VIDDSAERDMVGAPQPVAYQVHWFHPDRPVEGTVFVRPQGEPDDPDDAALG
jgi:hypothetical protein